MQILFSIFMCTQESSNRTRRLKDDIGPKVYLPFETTIKCEDVTRQRDLG